MAKYYKVYKTPIWVVLHPSAKFEAVKKWFKKADAFLQSDLSDGFMETVLSFKSRGWESKFKDGAILPDQLLNQAFVEHIKKVTLPSATFGYPTNLTCRMDRKLSTEADYKRLFNEMLSLVSDIDLSYLFQIQEKCHNAKGENYKLFLTDDSFSPKVITTLADKVIEIGEGPQYTIDLTNAPKSVSSFLETKLTAIIGETK